MRRKILTGLMIVGCICLLSACSQYDLDGKVVVVDGQVYELQHVLMDTFKAHKIDSKELDKMQKTLGAAKSR